MIKGITPKLSEAGKIKIGKLGDKRKAKGGREYRLPVKLDHFIVTRTTRDENGDLMVDDDLMLRLAEMDQDTGEVAANKLREIPIILHSNEIDEVFPTSYALYSSKKLACSGDGETATRWEIAKDGSRTGKKKEMACPCDLLAQRKCKAHGTLHCSIRVPGSAVAGAVYRWRTTSIISVERMIGSLLQIKNTCGILQGLPLWLCLESITVSPPDAPSSTVYVCHVQLRARDLAEAQQKALELVQMRNSIAGEVAGEKAQYRRMIAAPASEDEPEDEQADVAQEFHPSESNSVVDGSLADAQEDAAASTADALKSMMKGKEKKDEPAPPADDEEPPIPDDSDYGDKENW